MTEKIWVRSHELTDERKARIEHLQNSTNFSRAFCALLERNGIYTLEEANAYLLPLLRSQLRVKTLRSLFEANNIEMVGPTGKEAILSHISSQLKSNLHDPFLMRDMDKTVERLSRAIDKKERLLFHGDYDADGVTTTTLAKKGFALLGLEIDVFCPNRFRDGYGLNPKNMIKFYNEYDVVLSGDTGIRAFEAGQLWSEQSSCDLLVTDHHEPFIHGLDELHKAPADSVIEEFEDEYIALPKAYSMVNPHRLGDPYPCKGLAGVGVIFKVLEALFKHRGEPTQPLYQLLDLVAVGCIADLVPQIERFDELDVEVRTLTLLGLKILNNSPALWMQSLREVNSISGDVTGTTIGFAIGPMLNAPGRLDDPGISVEFLLCEDPERSIELAKELRAINLKRQGQSGSVPAIVERLSEDPKRTDYGVVAVAVDEEEYHIGVAGLVAGKLVEHYYRPTVAVAPTTKPDGEVVYKGSGRSIPGVSILEALNDVKDEIGEYIYGGHEQACGLTLLPEQLDEFIQAFRKAIAKHGDEVLIPRKTYDDEVSLLELTRDFTESLHLLEPYCTGNSEPIFLIRDLEVTQAKRHGKGNGIGFTLQKGMREIRGVSFSNGDEWEELFESKNHEIVDGELFKKDVFVDVLCSPSINEWRGNVSVQLFIKDIKFQ